MIPIHSLPALGALTIQMQAVARIATSADPTLWYVTRAAAISSYVALTVTVGLGLLRSMARQIRLPNTTTFWLLDELHQFLALLTAAFLALHLLTLLLDPYLPFSLANLLIPIGEPYSAFGSALGVLGLYAMVVILASSWLRRFLSYSFWRALHYVSFVAFVLVTAHGLFAGSDTGQPWAIALYLGSCAAIGVLCLLRIVISPRMQTV